MSQIPGLKVFFESFKYLTKCVRYALENIDQNQLYKIFDILIKGKDKMIIVDGQGRSLESVLLAEDCLEHNGFPIILPASNANLRPWKKGDILFFNSGSGKGSILEHIKAAKENGIEVIGMTKNEDLLTDFPNLLIIPKNSERKCEFAPLGTEFELTTAIIGCLLGYSITDTPEQSIKNFNEDKIQILDGFEKTAVYYEDEIENLLKFINVIQDYLPKANPKKVYFRGVGRDAIINRVAAIRYGHLHKEPDIDLHAIYEGHWDLREKDDLVILTSGSGYTSQTMDYAMQAFVSGARIFAITSFKDSDLGKFADRCDGYISVPGRKASFSMYNLSQEKRTAYLPEFELNTYITLDALLAQVAHNNNISEDDMNASHRPKIFE